MGAKCQPSVMQIEAWGHSYWNLAAGLLPGLGSTFPIPFWVSSVSAFLTVFPASPVPLQFLMVRTLCELA